MPATLDRPPLRGVEWLTELLSLPAHRVYDYARQGMIPCVRLGRRLLFDPVAIDEWIRAGGSPLDDPA